jgi:hypothetical protein
VKEIRQGDAGREISYEPLVYTMEI